MPVSLENLHLSWQMMPPEGDMQRIYLLGVPKETIESHVRTLEVANIKPWVMDLKPLCLVRAVKQEEAIIVNLERALTPSGRLGGHIVQGHVDGMTEVAAVTPSGDHWVFSFQLAPFFGDLIVEKGSITVNGISLTVARLAPHRFDAAVLAFTRDHTSLRLLSAGDKVNIELDIIGKYVQRMLRSEAYSKGGGAGGKRQEDTSSELTREKLGTLGFL